MEIRLESERDFKEVENLTREAFWDVYRPGCNEHVVLHKLRKSDAFIKELDYVIVEDEKIVGNIVYTKMYKDDALCDEIIAFGPISIHPEYQRKGIGKQMIQYTFQKAKELGYKAVLITGDTNYYHPLGFASASKFGIYLPGLDQTKEAAFFMVIELEEGYLKEHTGIYHFDSNFEVSEEELEAFERNFPHKEKRKPQEGDLA